MNIKTASFIDDGEKMRDFFTLTKEEFLDSYSYLTEEEYDATAKYVEDHNLEKFSFCVCNRCRAKLEKEAELNGERMFFIKHYFRGKKAEETVCSRCGEKYFYIMYEIV